METEYPFPWSQEPTTCPYREPDESSPRPPNGFKIHFNIILPSAPKYFKWVNYYTNHCTYIKFTHLNIKNAPTCFGPKTIIRELPLLKS